MPTNYLRYAPEMKTPQQDEMEAIDGIIAAMTTQSEIVRDRGKHAMRASHAKSMGLAAGESSVASGLPPELAQGLFAVHLQRRGALLARRTSCSARSCAQS